MIPTIIDIFNLSGADIRIFRENGMKTLGADIVAISVARPTATMVSLYFIVKGSNCLHQFMFECG